MRKKQAREVRIEIMEDAVSMDDALDRLAKAIALEMHRDFLVRSVGQVLPVLFETEEEGCSVGHSDTYVLVKVPVPGLRGRTLPVRITGTEGDRLLGEPAEA